MDLRPLKAGFVASHLGLVHSVVITRRLPRVGGENPSLLLQKDGSPPEIDINDVSPFRHRLMVLSSPSSTCPLLLLISYFYS